MTTQLPLFEEPTSKIQRSFLKFHGENPNVYDELVRLARAAVCKGKRKVGIKMLWEVLRWNVWLETTDDGSEFKLCNNYPSRYARLIMKQEKDLAGVFDLRELRS